MRQSKQRREALSDLARARLLSRAHEPLFFAEWDRTPMIHYELDPPRCSNMVPFPPDL